MKKITLLFSALLCVAASLWALQPAEVVGHWESKWVNEPSPDREIKSKQKETFDFNADGTFWLKAEIQMTIIGQPSVDMFLYSELKGKYDVAGDSIMFKVDPSTIKMDFPEDEIRLSGQIDPDQESMIKSTIHYNMRSLLPEIKKAIKDYTINDVVITDDKKGKKMTCEDEGIKKEFTQKKKK